MLTFFFAICKQTSTIPGMPRVLILHRQDSSDWVSCRSILRNLRKSYLDAFDGDVDSLTLPSNLTSFSSRRIAQEILGRSPNHIVFIDHRPHPKTILDELCRLGFPSGRVGIHVYGDFVLDAPQWLDSAQSLAQLKPIFLCASAAQMQLVKNFLKSHNGVFTVPFSVDTNQFHFESEARQQFRKSLQAKQDESLIVYTGRLSEQKNCTSLIQSFSHYHRVFNPNSRLLLAGPIDDMGIPYRGKKSPPGVYAFDLCQAANNFFKTHNLDSNQGRNPISYLGDLDSQTLFSLYNAADIYFSLSTHNDEDFGVAPAEALMCGCPAALTEWGGFTSFKKGIDDELVQLIPLTLNNTRWSPNEVLSVKTLCQLSSVEKSDERRQDLSKKAVQYLSTASVAERIRSVYHQPTSNENVEFNDLFKSVDLAFRLNPSSPFGQTHQYSNLYQAVYNDYR